MSSPAAGQAGPDGGTAGRTAVVVGTSVGGVRTAQALRSGGWQGRLVLVGAEPDEPYDKPPLSKQVLAGTWQPDQTRLLQPGEAEAEGFELRLGSAAVALDPAGRAVHLADGSEVPYDVVVLATGADARPSPWRPGTAGVHVVRTLQDCLRLRDDLARPGPVVVVGGSVLGGEVASTAAAQGHPVTLVDPAPVPMARLLGDDVGRWFTALHDRHGVATRFGTGVERLDGSPGAFEVGLTDGSAVPAAVVVVAIGAVPATGWLVTAGLQLEDGIVCDDHGRARGARDVYAVGDVARWQHPGRSAHARVEHWTSAVEQAACVAQTVLHPEQAPPHAPVEYVWTDQHDWRAQVVGRSADGAPAAVVGDPEEQPGRFAVVYGDGAALCGALLVNWPKAMLVTRRLLAAGATVAQVEARLRALPAPVAR